MSRKRTLCPHVARKPSRLCRLALLVFAFGLVLGRGLAVAEIHASDPPVEDSRRETPAWQPALISSSAGDSGSPGSVSLAQADNEPPAVPELITPAFHAAGLATAVTLQATASDPNSDTLTLSFYGRPHATGDAPFTLVVIPDTQYYSRSDSAIARFVAQMEWIVDQRDTLGIVFATHVGDLVDHGSSVPEEWQRASNAMAVLDTNGVPNGVVPGNHDLDTVNGPDSDFLTYDQYFPPSRYASFPWYGSYLGDPADGINDFGVNRLNKDSYQLFSAGGMDFLIIHLELDPPQYAIDWANAVLAHYPDRRAIITTHAFIDANGARRSTPYVRHTIGQGAEYVWQNLVFPNCNVFLVLSGHYPGEANRTDPNQCDRPVHQVIQDYQSRPNGGDGWLRYFIFEPAQNQIEVYTYSPTRFQFETDSNSRFTLSYEMASVAPFQLIGSVSIESGATGEVLWEGLEPNTTYEWYVRASDGQQETDSAVWDFTTGDAGNQTPEATNDSYSTEEDQPLFVAAPGVLGNDSAPAGRPLHAELAGGPVHGALTLNPDGSFSYTPNANYYGSDGFTYQAGDGLAVSAVATVTLTVNPVNDAPTAANDLATVPQNGSTVIPVLSNDSDVEGDALSILAVGAPAHGTAVANSDGTITYTPAADYAGSDSFSYTISDGQGGSATATVTVIVIAPSNTVIFADGFECGPDAWSEVVNGGAMEFNQSAAYNSPCGMKLNITSAGPAYLIDHSPVDETSYHARFAFHPNELSMAQGDEYPIFRAYRPDAVPHLTVDVRYDGSQFQVRAGLADNLRRWSFTPWATLTDQWHLVDVSWRSATGPGRNDGGLALSVDDLHVAAGDSIDNDQQRIEWVQLGAMHSIEPTTSGSTYFDEFASSRDGAEIVGSMVKDALAGLTEEEYDDAEDPAQSPTADRELYLPKIRR